MSEADNTTTTTQPDSAHSQSKVDQLAAALRDVEEEVAKLRAKLEIVETERDDYKRTLFDLIPRKPFSFGEEELRDLNENGVTWETIESDLSAVQP